MNKEASDRTNRRSRQQLAAATSAVSDDVNSREAVLDELAAGLMLACAWAAETDVSRDGAGVCGLG